TARDVVNAATVNGAKALQRSDIGRLAVGAKADLLVVDLGNYAFGPILDPIRALVHIGNAAHVRHVVVDGEVLVDNGRLARADEGSLLAAVRASGKAVYERFPEFDFAGRDVRAFSVPSFPDW